MNYEILKRTLTERSRQLFVRSDTLTLGYGGIAAASRATGLSVMVVRYGLAECRAIESRVAPIIEPYQGRQPDDG